MVINTVELEGTIAESSETKEILNVSLSSTMESSSMFISKHDPLVVYEELNDSWMSTGKKSRSAINEKIELFLFTATIVREYASS